MADHFDMDPSRFLNRLRELAPATAKRVVEAIRPHAPVGKGRPDGREGGALRDGLDAKVGDLADGVEFAMTSDQPYTKYVIAGTAPHVIEARNARALRFWMDGDNVVFAHRVNHPGTAPNPFYHKADDEIREIVRQDVGRAMSAVLRP